MQDGCHGGRQAQRHVKFFQKTFFLRLLQYVTQSLEYADKSMPVKCTLNAHADRRSVRFAFPSAPVVVIYAILQ
jgi:hypothetical protein